MSLSEATNFIQDGALARPDTYFLSPELSQRADLLIHLTENSHLIPLIRGGEGMGKTTFIQHLLDVAPENWIPALVSADVMLQPDALLAHLARLFDRDDRSDRLMDDLATRFDDLRHDGHLPVIIVDDAHLLPETSIITLLRLHGRGPSNLPLAQVLLFAEPEIDDLLKAPQLRAMNLQSLQHLDMPEFTLEQTERYLQHLLSMYGSGTLADSQIQRIYEETDGSPGLIKQQAQQLMDSSRGPTAAPFTARKRFSGKAIIGGGFAAIVILLVLIYQDAINALFFGESKVVATAQKEKEWTDDSSSLVVPDYARKEIPLPGPEDTLEGPADQDAPADAEVVDEEVNAVSIPGESRDDAEGAPAEAQAGAAPPEAGQASHKIKSAAAEQSAGTDQPAKMEKVVAEDASVVSLEKAGDKKGQTPAKKKEPAITKKEKLPKKEDAAPGKVVSAAPPAKVETQQKAQKKELQKATIQQAKPTVVETDKSPKPKTQKEAPLTDVAVKYPATGPKAPEAVAVNKSGSPEQEVRITPAPVEERSIKLSQVEAAPKQVAVDQAAGKAAETSAKITEKKAAVTTAAPEKPTVKKVQAATNGFLREDWLLQQTPSSYTIQVASMQDEKGIAGYIRRNSVQGTIAYYHTMRNGNDWFPVLYGVYPTRENAEKAQGLLPEKIRKSGAWIRSLGSVQKDIKAR